MHERDSHDQDSHDHADDQDEVGSVAEEAAKLLGAFSSWTREHLGDVHDAGDGLRDVASRAAEAVHELDGHIATGSEECRACPVCRAVRAVRRVDPQVTEHLSAAATSLARAVSAFMAAPAHDDPDAGGSQQGGTDHESRQG